MRTMENLEYATVLEELQDLVGKFLSKFKEIEERKFILTIGSTDIIIELGVRLHKTKYMIEENIQGDFANRVKNALKNQRLKALYLKNEDRVVVFEFGEKRLVFEMFGKGNAIVTENDITIAAYEERSWADRKIKRNEPYSYPKSNLKKSLSEAISDKFIITALLALPLGKEYAKELLTRFGIDEKKPGSSIDKEQIEQLEREIEKLKSNKKAYVFLNNAEEVVDYGLTLFSQYSTMKKREFESFNDALDFFYWNAEQADDPEIAKLKVRINTQKEYLEKLKIEEIAAKQKGDFIYSRYKEIEKILDQARKMKLDEIETKLKDYNAKVNKKEKEIEIELE